MSVRQNHKPILVDTSKKEDTRKLVYQKPILTSHDNDWHDVVFEHHLQPAHETPEVYFQQHVLVVNLNRALIEAKIDGRCERRNVTVGDFTLIPTDVKYWNADLTENEFIVLTIEPQYLLNSCREFNKGNLTELIPVGKKPDPFIYGTAIALQQELINDYYGCGLYAETLLNSLSVHLLRNYSTSKIKLKQYTGGLSHRKLQASIDYIQANLEETVTLDDLANVANISSYYFCRLFKKSTGVTPHQYVLHQRIELGKRLLKRDDLPIAEIALSCGFANQSSFSAAFRRSVGVAPKAYRLQQRFK